MKPKEKHFFVFIEALCVPSICSPFNNQKNNKGRTKLSHLTNLTLADEEVEGVEWTVDLLIGLD